MIHAKASGGGVSRSTQLCCIRFACLGRRNKEQRKQTPQARYTVLAHEQAGIYCLLCGTLTWDNHSLVRWKPHNDVAIFTAVIL